jgi:hypothetical protein
MMKRPKSSVVLLLLAALCFAGVVLAADIESRQFRYCPPGTFRDQNGACRVNGGVPPGWVPVANRGNGYYVVYGNRNGGGGLHSPSRFFNNKGNNGLNPLRGRRRLPPLSVDWNMAHYIRIAHGAMAALAFLIFFPFGAISVRILPGVLAVAAHAALQLMGFVLYIVAFGLGLWMATRIRWSFFSFVSPRTPGQANIH